MKRTNTVEQLSHDDKGTSCIDVTVTLNYTSQNKKQSRDMNRSQELWNAVTMFVPPFFGLYYLFSGSWLMEDDLARAQESLSLHNATTSTSTSFYDASHSVFNGYEEVIEGTCISSSYFPYLHAMPPLATIAVALGYILHSPCSILYHYMCAFKLEPGHRRMDHWSRRLDQAMIHVMGFFVNFGTSGNIKYTFFTFVFGIDCIYRLFQPGFKPKSNQIRMASSFLLSIVPTIMYGYYDEFMKFLIIYGLSGWIFAAYPLGGYSHGIFHLIAFLACPLQLGMSTKLVLSQHAIRTAAKCAVLAKAASSGV